MIGFLQPLLLAALPLAALPLVLHLMARRDPPTVPFPAVPNGMSPGFAFPCATSSATVRHGT